jgi:hypothetical protein
MISTKYTLLILLFFYMVGREREREIWLVGRWRPYSNALLPKPMTSDHTPCTPASWANSLYALLSWHSCRMTWGCCFLSLSSGSAIDKGIHSSFSFRSDSSVHTSYMSDVMISWIITWFYTSKFSCGHVELLCGCSAWLRNNAFVSVVKFAIYA